MWPRRLLVDQHCVEQAYYIGMPVLAYVVTVVQRTLIMCSSEYYLLLTTKNVQQPAADIIQLVTTSIEGLAIMEPIADPVYYITR